MLPRLPDLFWPTAQLGADLDYTFDTAPDLIPIQDSIASVSVSVQPSGTGELQIDTVAISEFKITTTLSGGVAGRLYFVQLVVTTTSNPPRVFPYLIGLQISPLLFVAPFVPPESPFFGAPVVAANQTNAATGEATIGPFSAAGAAA
jgi:hypothetical protein